ncbi:MEDS domain-containing protein [Pseudonocardia thermophila]|nr:MEDS domain-containing protein [Pseudonocardia thermophila]
MASFDSTVRHACAVAVSDEHLWELSSAFLSAGLAAGDQVKYFDDGTSDRVLERMFDDGVDIDASLASGQLEVVPPEATRAAILTPIDVMRGLVDELIEDALAEGYSGVRWTGQLSHALNRPAGMLDYELMLDAAVAGRPARVLCLYDRAHYPDDVIEDMRRGHRVEIETTTVYDDNLLRITSTGIGSARLAGEVDHSNRPQVRKLLLAELDRALRSPTGPHEIRLDVSSLRFIDVAGAVGLVHAAEEFPSSHKLVLDGVRPRVARVLDRCGAPFASQLMTIPRPDRPIPSTAGADE